MHASPEAEIIGNDESREATPVTHETGARSGRERLRLIIGAATHGEDEEAAYRAMVKLRDQRTGYV